MADGNLLAMTRAAATGAEKNAKWRPGWAARVRDEAGRYTAAHEPGTRDSIRGVVRTT